MMNTKPIIADPLRLYALGVRNLMDMAILVHVGRCGLIGTQRNAIKELLGVSYDTARSGMDRLQELKLITQVSKTNTTGCARNYCVTQRGWKLLTDPADFSLFPHAQSALATHESRKKSRQAPPENQTPAAGAAGIEVGGGKPDDRAAGAAGGALAKRSAALAHQAPGDQGGTGPGETQHAELAARA